MLAHPRGSSSKCSALGLWGRLLPEEPWSTGAAGRSPLELQGSAAATTTCSSGLGEARGLSQPGPSGGGWCWLRGVRSGELPPLPLLLGAASWRSSPLLPCPGRCADACSCQSQGARGEGGLRCTSGSSQPPPGSCPWRPPLTCSCSAPVSSGDAKVSGAPCSATGQSPSSVADCSPLDCSEAWLPGGRTASGPEQCCPPCVLSSTHLVTASSSYTS
jgi:hypothetical protein